MQPMQQNSPESKGPQEEAQGGSISDLIKQIDISLTGLSQVIGKQIPEAGQALEKINEEYRQIMSAVMSQMEQGVAQEQRAPREPSRMVDQETGGKPAVAAY